jgi:hypothetical protein
MIYGAATLEQTHSLISTTINTTDPFAHFDGLVWMMKFPEPDKDGNTLFEGDVVEVGETAQRFVLRFGKATRNILTHSGDAANGNGGHDLKITGLLGNIHEKPDLLIQELPF